MNDLLVSIVIPVYNSGKIINRCLDSLVRQTYKNIEIICVNDCSKDNSLSVLQSYASKDSRIKIVDHKENKNAGGARNSGIKIAKGHYICFVDNDDWVTDDAIETLMSVSDNGNADMVTADWITYFSEDRQFVKHNLPLNGSYQENIKYICYNGFRMLGCLWKSSILFENELFFPEKIFFEDNAMIKTLFCHAKVVKYVRKPLYYYFESPTSVTGFITPRKITDRITTMEMGLSNLKKHGFYDENKDLFDFACLKMCYNTIMMLTRCKYQGDKMDFERNKALIQQCLPNNHFKELNTIKRIVLSYPYFTYEFLRVVKPIRPLLGKLIK